MCHYFYIYYFLSYILIIFILNNIIILWLWYLWLCSRYFSWKSSINHQTLLTIYANILQKNGARKIGKLIWCNVECHAILFSSNGPIYIWIIIGLITSPESIIRFASKMWCILWYNFHVYPYSISKQKKRIMQLKSKIHFFSIFIIFLIDSKYSSL